MIREKELAKMVEYETGYLAANVAEIFDATSKIIVRELLKGENIIKWGSFLFESRKIPERTTRNPMTGEKFIKPEHLKCLVRPNRGVKAKFYDDVK